MHQSRAALSSASAIFSVSKPPRRSDDIPLCSLVETDMAVGFIGLGPMFNLERHFKHKKLKHLWDQVLSGMTVDQAEQIMGFKFSRDSANAARRIVYSDHSPDHLPFYLVADGSSGIVVRRHSIRSLDELSLGA